MPRQRGAAEQRQVRRKRGEHDKQTSGARAQQRTDTHAVAEPTTDSLQLFINQAMKYPLLTAAEEVELAQGIERGDLAAKERLINSNLRLVIKFARRYQGFGLPLADLVQEAMLGTDPRRGEVRLAAWLQVLDLRRALDQAVDPARPRQHRARRADSRAHRPARAHGQPHDHQLAVELNREPTDKEVAKRAKLPLDEVMAVRDLTRITTSLDTPVGDGDTTLGELHAESTADLEDEVMVREQEEAVGRSPGEASRRRAEDHHGPVRHRWPARGFMRDAARELGVTQKAARELEERALARLATDGSLSGWRAAA